MNIEQVKQWKNDHPQTALVLLAAVIASVPSFWLGVYVHSWFC